MNYFPLTAADRQEMLRQLGLKDVRELFSDIPADRMNIPLDTIPSAMPEDRLLFYFQELASRNTAGRNSSFLGGGAYNHFVPEVVNFLSQKGEFLTPYTPYQPEVSQGSLQAIFEYQTMIAMLTGLDVANASLYDGGTAAAEGLLLALRKSRTKRILIAENLHPEYIEIMNSYIQNFNFEAVTVAYDRITGQVNLADLRDKLDDESGGFIFQSPNFLGVVEDSEPIVGAVHERKAFAIQVVAEAMSLPFLKSPGDCGVDVVVGEAQSFGLPLGFGGPYLGFMAARKDFLRQMPGRIVGETVDSEGRRGYVLTLSTREQHIKREKATSNICTNQAWCALRAGVYLASMGQEGMQKIARINHLNTAYFVKRMEDFSHVKIRYRQDFFNEVVLEFLDADMEDVLRKAHTGGILPGIPLGWFYRDMANCLLLNFTENHGKEDIDRLIRNIGEMK